MLYIGIMMEMTVPTPIPAHHNAKLPSFSYLALIDIRLPQKLFQSTNQNLLNKRNGLCGLLLGIQVMRNEWVGISEIQCNYI